MASLFKNTGVKHPFYIPSLGRIELAVYKRVDMPDLVFYASAELIAQVSPDAKGKDHTFLRVAACKRSIMQRENLPADDVRSSLPDDVVARHYGYDYMGRLFMTPAVASVFVYHLVPDLVSHLFDVRLALAES